MEHFVIKLKPSREDFMFSMTPEERQVMQSHAVYWAGLMDQGVAVVYGPVNDPEGSYGLGVIAVEDAAAVDMIRRADPAVTFGVADYHVAPMLRALYKGHTT